MPQYPSSQIALNAVHRQAKILSRRLQIPLTSARQVLAKGPYQCSEWSDLLARITHRTLNESGDALTRVAFDENALAYFERAIDNVIGAIAYHVRFQEGDLMWKREVVYSVFTEHDTPVKLSELFPSIPMPEWESRDLGPDPEVLLEATVDIDGQQYQLIAIRTFQVELYDVSSTHVARSSMNFLADQLHILWADPDLWRKAVELYLNEDNCLEELLLPTYSLDSTMLACKDWLSGMLDYLRGWYWQSDTARLLPLTLNGCYYLVFGFSINSTYSTGRKTSPSRAKKYVPPSVICLGETPICIEKSSLSIPTPWPIPTSNNWDLASGHNAPALFIRPACTDDVDIYEREVRDGKTPLFFYSHATKFSWSLEATNIELAKACIDKVAAGTAAPKDGNTSTVVLDVSQYGPHKLLDPTLVVTDDPDEWQSVPLVRFSYGDNRMPDVRWYEVSDLLYHLIKAIGKQRLIRALDSRLVGHDMAVYDLLKKQNNA